MSVVQSRIVFCEGKSGSLDYALLNRLIGDTTAITIIPAGSKFTFSAFAQGYFFSQESIVDQSQVINQPYLVFRDRDFDEIPTQVVQLLPLSVQQVNRPIFLTHRAAIENYLLDATLLDRYWTEKYQEKQENPSSKWGHKNSPGIEQITNWIAVSAKKLKEYQAARWALADLLRIDGVRKRLETTWLTGSGYLPNDMTLANCKRNAIALINNFKSSADQVTEEKFEQSLTKYHDQFSQVEFWDNHEYLIWFHGKDLQKMMQRERQHYISLEEFFKWAVRSLDITQHYDLVELRQHIKQLSR